MVSVKRQLNPKTFKEQNLNKSKGIFDDFAVRKSINSREGTITKAPVDNIDIVNKLALDTAIGAIPGGGDVSSTLNLTDETLVQGDGGAKGVKTTTVTAANVSDNTTKAHTQGTDPNDHAPGSDDQVAGDFNHDDLANIPGNDHIDWTADQGATNIDSGNYVDSTYVAGDFNHNDLANLNAGDNYEHITQAQKDALHTAGTDPNDHVEAHSIASHNDTSVTGAELTASEALTSGGTLGKFKQSSSTYTDNDTSQTFTDAFCTATSLVIVSVTDASEPQGVWIVTSAAGEFTITSDTAETDDIDFDYYIIKN